MFGQGGVAAVLLYVSSLASQTFPSNSNSNSSLIYALVGGAATGLFVFLLGLIKEARRGRQDTSKVIAEATQSSVAASKSMIEEYRLEVDIVRKNLRITEGELVDAKQRIGNLEKDLGSARQNRKHIEDELRDANDKVRNSETQIKILTTKLDELGKIVPPPG